MFREKPVSLLVKMMEVWGIFKMSAPELPDPLPKFLEVKEVAILLRVSKRTIYDWVSQRKIPFRKAGDRTLFDRDEILDWTRPEV